MKNIILLVFFSVFLFSCDSNKNYIGVEIPDFNNPEIDSLIAKYENARTLHMEFYVEHGRIDSKLSRQLYLNDPHDKVISIIDKDGDMNELTKYGNYNRNCAKAARAWDKKNKK